MFFFPSFDVAAGGVVAEAGLGGPLTWWWQPRGACSLSHVLYTVFAEGTREDIQVCPCDLTRGSAPGPRAVFACCTFPEHQGGDCRLSLCQFDYEAVASRLFAVASQQGTPSQNRKRLYKVIRK